MNIPSPDLHQLIRSLTPSEKRTFKVLSPSGGSDNQYMRLFDLLARQTEYDEQAAFSGFQMTRNAFAFNKKYLYDLVLARLAGATGSIEADLRRMLTEAEFLYGKGLYKQQMKMLIKAKESALRFELVYYWAEIIEMQSWICWKDMNIQGVKNLLREKEDVFARIRSEHAFRQLESELIIKFAQSGTPVTSRQKSEIQKTLRSSLLADEASALTFQAKLSYFNIHCVCRLVLNDISAAHQFQTRLVNLHLSRPERTRYKTTSFLIALNNLIHLSRQLNRQDEVRRYLDLLEDHSRHLRVSHEKSWAFFTFHYNNLLYYIENGLFQDAIPSAEKLQRTITQATVDLEDIQSTTLYLTMAEIWFGAGKLSECLKLLNILRNNEELPARPDLKSRIRILYVIAHFEKGNRDTAARLAKSALRTLRNGVAHHETERVLMEYFAAGSSPSDFNEDRLKKLKQQLERCQSRSGKEGPLRNFDILAWIDSKLEGKSFQRVIQSKQKNKSGR